MSKKYIVEGGKKLEGTTYVSGSKNASLPIIAAAILNPGITKLYNVPNIHDTQMMFKILETLGCKIKKNNGKIIIDSSSMNSYKIPDDLMRQMRSTVILGGAILGRFKEVTFSMPGFININVSDEYITSKVILKILITLASLLLPHSNFSTNLIQKLIKPT